MDNFVSGNLKSVHLNLFLSGKIEMIKIPDNNRTWQNVVIRIVLTLYKVRERRPESISRFSMLFYPESIRMRRMLESLNERRKLGRLVITVV